MLHTNLMFVMPILMILINVCSDSWGKHLTHLYET